jgi:hypothetical protein
MANCANCEGEKVASTCIIWEGIDVPFDSFNKFIEAIYAVTSAGKDKIDLKTLSDSGDTSLQNAVQILIDREVKALHQSTSTSTSTSTNNSAACNINVSSLDNCSTCTKSFCEKLQLMVNEIALLKAEVNQLKTQI